MKFRAKEDFILETQKDLGLTPQEAGELIGCSAYTIKELARGKRIPFYKIGTRYLFSRSALLDWVRAQEKENYDRQE